MSTAVQGAKLLEQQPCCIQALFRRCIEPPQLLCIHASHAHATHPHYNIPAVRSDTPGTNLHASVRSVGLLE